MKNFGENVTFAPRETVRPRDEAHVLALLDAHAGRQVRVRGSLHAWSDGVATNDLLLDLRGFDQVHIEIDEAGRSWAQVGAGCILERLVEELDHHGLTLPTVGAVLEQTIAGAVATATHGSGSPSLSHFVDAIRVAAFDPETGRARIFEFTSGDDLRAARCGLGYMGVVLSVRLRVSKPYAVTETISHHATLAEVLRQRVEYPLQQFMLIPFAWRFVAFNRKVESQTPGLLMRLRSRAYRLYDHLALELLSHQLLSRVLLKFSKRGNPSSLVARFYRHLAPMLLHGPRITAPAMTTLTLHSKHHAVTKHVEMELFVAEPQLEEFVRLVTAYVDWCADRPTTFPPDLRAAIAEAGLGPELEAARGRYMHHYALVFRHVLPDDTLISMTSDGEARYAVGVFTYLAEEQRGPYYAFCALLARICVRLFGARLHWGKYFPLGFEEIEHLYPNLEAYRAHCQTVDPEGTFRNAFALRVLGFEEATPNGRSGT